MLDGHLMVPVVVVPTTAAFCWTAPSLHNEPLCYTCTSTAVRCSKRCRLSVNFPYYCQLSAYPLVTSRYGQKGIHNSARYNLRSNHRLSYSPRGRLASLSHIVRRSFFSTPNIRSRTTTQRKMKFPRVCAVVMAAASVQVAKAIDLDVNSTSKAAPLALFVL